MERDTHRKLLFTLPPQVNAHRNVMNSVNPVEVFSSKSYFFSLYR